MAAPGYPYQNGLFNEDHLPPTGLSQSPPPPYHIIAAERLHRASTSYPQGQGPPILTTFQTHQHGTQLLGHVAPGSPTSAYAVLASEIVGGQGQVYHHLVQVPYPGTGYPPGSPPVPPGFPPPRSSPLSSLLPHQTSAHLVPQPLPTHTGRDPGPVPSSIPPNPPVPAHQPTSTSISTSTPTATATNCAEPSWTPEQDRLLLRLHKDEQKLLPDISAALEDVFQVKRDASAVKKRLSQLRARSKVWSEDQLKQAVQKAMQQLNPVLQEELTQASAIPNAANITSSTTDREQLANVTLAVRLELDDMVRQGNMASDMEQKLLDEQRKRNAQYAAMRQTDHGRNHRVEESRDQVEDYEIV